MSHAQTCVAASEPVARLIGEQGISIGWQWPGARLLRGGRGSTGTGAESGAKAGPVTHPMPGQPACWPGVRACAPIKGRKDGDGPGVTSCRVYYGPKRSCRWPRCATGMPGEQAPAMIERGLLVVVAAQTNMKPPRCKVAPGRSRHAPEADTMGMPGKWPLLDADIGAECAKACAGRSWRCWVTNVIGPVTGQ